MKNGSDDCDDQDFGSISCVSLGFDEGKLQCTDQCTIVATGCRNCTSLTPPAGVNPTYIVDAANGNNNTAYEDCLPYRTITAALADASSGDVIWVAPGTYDANLGETFPLVIPDGVTLIGDEAHKGAGGGGIGATYIQGGGYNSVIKSALAVYFANSSGRISGFRIQALQVGSYHGAAIGAYRTTATISNNTLQGEYYGLRVYQGHTTNQNPLIQGNTFNGGYYGLYLQGASPKIRSNYFYTFTQGAILITNYSTMPSIPDLGTDHQTDRGENTFAPGRAIYLNSNVSIYALGNTWPNYQDPSCGSSGVIYVSASSGKVYWGYLEGQVCPAP